MRIESNSLYNNSRNNPFSLSRNRKNYENMVENIQEQIQEVRENEHYDEDNDNDNF